MRDPKRIDPLLALVRRIWMKSPDLRLGQLIDNCAEYEERGDRDVYGMEDDVLERRLREVYNVPIR